MCMCVCTLAPPRSALGGSWDPAGQSALRQSGHGARGPSFPGSRANCGVAVEEYALNYYHKNDIW